MKILIVSTAYVPETGAAPSRITNMAEGLRHKGVEVEVLTCMPNYPKGRIFDGYRGRFSMAEDINGVKVRRYWTYATVSKNPILRLFSMCVFGLMIWIYGLRISHVRKFDKIIVQSPQIVSGFFAMALFKGIYRKYVILNISDLWPLSAVELGAVKDGSLMYKVMAWMEKYLYSHCDAYQGQSNEIISHIKSFVPSKPYFLYRNLQHAYMSIPPCEESRTPAFNIVYAGLMGVAQDILGLIKAIDFKSIGAEFHLYGGGNQVDEIKQYISECDRGVVYHGTLEKKQMVETLVRYHASIVPLTVRIKGAVPSKIFDLMPVGVPILFCGGGEGADIVNEYNIGLTSDPGDYQSLKNNILKMIRMSETEYQQIRKNCLVAYKSHFSFDVQMDRYYEWIQR